jgi:hypothetical protein
MSGDEEKRGALLDQRNQPGRRRVRAAFRDQQSAVAMSARLECITA